MNLLKAILGSKNDLDVKKIRPVVAVWAVNCFLSGRDSGGKGAIHKFPGLAGGVIFDDQPAKIRREQYYCDIPYGTNSEFGFDYLRDNGIALRKEEQVQRGHYF